MKTTPRPAYYLNGVWRVDCIQCGASIRVSPNETAVCPTCYPGIRAVGYQPPKGYPEYLQALARGQVGVEIPSGVWRKVPDTETQRAALAIAEEKRHIIQAVYPKDKSLIEQILQQRPSKRFMNWFPPGHPALIAQNKNEETAADLIAESAAHGHPVNMEKIK